MSFLGIKYKNFGAKNLRKIFLGIIITLCIFLNSNKINCLKTEEFLLEADLNKELFSRMQYYTNIINDLKLSEKVSVGVKENNLYLYANQDFGASSHVFYLPKIVFLTSCDLYPFKEIFLKAINLFNSKSKIDLNKFSSSLLLTYEIMFLKFANKEKTKQHYSDLYKDEERMKEIENILAFEVNPEVTQYLNYMPKKNTRSLFFYNEEENQLAKDLNIDLITKIIFENTHKDIIEFVKQNFNEDVKVILINKKSKFYI